MNTPARREFHIKVISSVMADTVDSQAAGPQGAPETKLHSNCADVLGQLDGYDCFRFCDDGITHNIYVTGQGPSIIVMHELPGLTTATFAFAARLKKAGFRVYLPHLCGALAQRVDEAQFLWALHQSRIRAFGQQHVSTHLQLVACTRRIPKYGPIEGEDRCNWHVCNRSVCNSADA